MPSTRDQRPYNVAYYASHRAEEIDRVTRRQQATLVWLRELRRVPCMDCGGAFPPHVMDFDHRDPKTKAFSLAADKTLLKNRAVLKAEVAKCDIVCANCHRIRTARQHANGEITYGFAPSPSPPATAEAAKRRAAWHKRRREQMQLLVRIRELVACRDCGKSYPVCAMEFDHRNGDEKTALVSRMPGRVKIRTLLEEIVKCDIVCTNCHRNRSFVRRQSRGCVVMAASKASILEVRVRFPPPAPDQPRRIEESAIPYRFAA